ncbi:hypothetical protein SNE40_011542 [Patella caerulea]|uniref:Snurportin-1 n=1 Tax=Patella caerulea TaxID=87958 RepID=A0AAN8JLX8_PATCE
MDELTATLASSFAVSSDPNTTAAEHPRYALYKNRSSQQTQEDRRQKLLQIQKSRRFDFMSHARNLADGSWTAPGASEKVTSPEDEEEGMDVETVLKKPSRSFKNQLMYSEWLVEVPDDFGEEWVTVLCPVAKRCLVVASKGNTRAYTKGGYCLHTFPSHLPGGNRRQGSKYSDYTILDCLYSETQGIYFILDIMCWRGHPVYDSEAEFRFYWLQSKIEETPEVLHVSPSNPFKFVPLPNFPCKKEAIGIAMTTANFEIDGLLFFHKRSHYIIGSTPLVVWLKPYMVPEIIGIPIPQQIMKKIPASYVNYKTHIEEVKNTKQMNKNPPSMRDSKAGSNNPPPKKERVILSKGQKKSRRNQQRKSAGDSMEVASVVQQETFETVPTEMGDNQNNPVSPTQ